MLSGRAAMEGETPSDIIASILLKDPEPLATIRPGCPRSLIRLISRALKKDRECRYSSAGDLLADLKSAAAKPDQIRAPSPQRWRRYLLGAAVTCLSVLLASILLVRAHSAGAILDSIAVLPLRNNAGADLEFLADGLTDSLIGDLSEIPNLKVSPHSSVFQFRDQRRAPALIGKLLKTRTVLLGSVSQSADRLHVQLQLIDVDHNRPIWSDTYDPVWKELLEVEGNISREVEDKLRVALNTSTKRELQKRHDVRPEAYRLFLRGHSALHGPTQSDLEAAVLYFHRALEIDSTYGPAAVELANAYIGLADYVSPRETMPKARDFALRGIELGGAPSEAHAALGLVKLLYDWDWKAAERELRLDSPVNPRETESFSCYLHYKDAFGRTEEAVTTISKLLRQDPLSAWMNHEMGCVSYYARRYDKAIEQFARTVRISPDFQIAYVNGGRSFVLERRYEDGIRTLEQARKIDPKWPLTLSELAYAYAAAGNQQAARGLLNELDAIGHTRYVDAVPVALVYLRLGDRDRTFSFLEKAYSEKSSSIPWLSAEPRFDPVRSDPRFQNLLRRVGLLT
jgi:TolB-like protein/tetratricopeptide (TPR) repeat protein